MFRVTIAQLQHRQANCTGKLHCRVFPDLLRIVAAHIIIIVNALVQGSTYVCRGPTTKHRSEEILRPLIAIRERLEGQFARCLATYRSPSAVD